MAILARGRSGVPAVVLLVGLFAMTVSSVFAETIYFHNKRTLDVQSYEIKGSLIYLTLDNGRRVYMRADSVDWEGTQQLKDTDYILSPTEYAMVDNFDDEDDADFIAGGRVLTAADLRKGVALGLRKRAVPTMVIEVPGGTPWIDSGINLQSGKRVVLRATGQIDLGGNVVVTPSGLAAAPTSAKARVPSLAFGALLGRIGLAGKPFPVGSQRDFLAPTPGRLYFGVNDATAVNNSGAFSVVVKLPSSSRRSSGSGTMSSVSTDSAPSAPTSSARPPQRPVAGTGAIDRARRTRDAVESGR